MNIPTNEQPCIEVVVSRPRPGVSHDEVVALSAKLQAWATTQPGFRARRLVHDPKKGTYVDWVEWASADDATRAAEACMQEPFAPEMERVLDFASMTMLHAREVR